MEDQMRAYMRAWVAQGERDLLAAERQIQIQAWSVCCWLCEQAVEKHLKALHILRTEGEPPRTHKIVELARDLGVPPELYSRLHVLETDYIKARYPVPSASPDAPDSYDEETALNRLGRARAVIDWVRTAMAEKEPTDDGDA